MSVLNEVAHAGSQRFYFIVKKGREGEKLRSWNQITNNIDTVAII